MTPTYLSQLNTAKGDDKKIVLPETDETPVSASEKLVREDIKKLTQNAEEIRKLKEQVEKQKEDSKKE
jgi:transposase